MDLTENLCRRDYSGMDRNAPKPPKNEREARLAKALRDNLRRRKAGPGIKPPASEDAGGDDSKT